VRGVAVFLVQDNLSANYLVFTARDPRIDGYNGKVNEGVTLDYDVEAISTCPDGQEEPKVCVGRSRDNPNHYKVLKYRKDRKLDTAYEPIEGIPVIFFSWHDYVKLRLVPPDPDQTGEEGYFQYLDDLDRSFRERRRRPQLPDMPASADRDGVAEWVAKQHRIVDSSIREVWYLPGGAPADEIRLLEVSDRIARNGDNAVAIDFGLDVGGANFRLFVADVTSEQLDQLQLDPARLPQGWRMDGGKVWRRWE
jgi:hypothetical protein